MRSKLNQALLALTTLLAFPVALLAHPGHPGHELSPPVPALPLTGEDTLTATVIIVGMLAVRAMWRRARA